MSKPKADIAALDELIQRCEESMLSPFAKRAAVPANSPEEVPAEPTIDEKLSEDDEQLAAWYDSLEEGE